MWASLQFLLILRFRPTASHLPLAALTAASLKGHGTQRALDGTQTLMQMITMQNSELLKGTFGYLWCAFVIFSLSEDGIFAVGSFAQPAVRAGDESKLWQCLILSSKRVFIFLTVEQVGFIN